MKIVPATEGDIDEIVAIERLSFARPWSRYAFKQELRSPFSYLFCIKVQEEDGERVAGYVGLWLIKEEAHITNIAVHPKYRRRGFARRLLEFVEQISLERGATLLTLEVRRSNQPAINMYRKKGFQITGVRKGYYFEDREDALIMTLYLSPQAVG